MAAKVLLEDQIRHPKCPTAALHVQELQMQALPEIRQSSRVRQGPVVIEIVGVAGTGKTTLAENLVARLKDNNFVAVQSRDARNHTGGPTQNILGTVRAGGDILAFLVFFLRNLVRGRFSFFPGAANRLKMASRHSIQRRTLEVKLGHDGIIVQEPGSLMHLLGHYMYIEKPLSTAIASEFIKASPTISFAIILRVDPLVSLARMNMRQRGIPKSMRQYEGARLLETIQHGDYCASTISSACASLGIKALELDVNGLDANAVTERSTEFLLPELRVAGGAKP